MSILLNAKLKNRVLPYIDDDLRRKFNIKTDESFALIVYFLMAKFDLSVNEAILSITDGANDKGIDAVYIDDGLGEVNIIQSEYKNNPNKIALGENKIRLTLNSIFDILDGKITENDANPLLANKISHLIDLANDVIGALQINVFFITNTQFPENINQIPEIKQALGEERNYNLNWLSGGALYNLESESKTVFTSNIKVKEDKYTQATDIGDIRGIVATISALDLIKLFEEAGRDNIFEFNIRNYLGSKPINKNIKKTALDPNKSKYFWFSNNGISLVCDKYTIGTKNPGYKNIELKNPKIINGGQTTKTLVELYEDLKNQLDFQELIKPLDQVEVLMRIYETSDPALINQITINTNTQNAISKQDLQSNNQIAKKMQDYFEEQGYGLEIKRKEYITGTRSKKLSNLRFVATQDEVLQFYVSIYKEQPHKAYISKTKVFEDYFKLIFTENPDDDLYLKYFRAFEIGYFVQNQVKKTDISNGNSFLTSGGIFLMYVMSQINPDIKNKFNTPISQSELNETFQKAKEVIKHLVQTRIDREKDLYSHNRYFKSEECKKDFILSTKN